MGRGLASRRRRFPPPVYFNYCRCLSIFEDCGQERPSLPPPKPNGSISGPMPGVAYCAERIYFDGPRVSVVARGKP